MTKGIANLQAFHDVVMQSKVLEVDKLPDPMDKNTFYFHTYQIDSADGKSTRQKVCLYHTGKLKLLNISMDDSASSPTAEEMQQQPEFLDYIRDNTESKVLLEVIDMYQDLVEPGLPNHYRLMSTHKKEAEKLKLRTFILALDAQLSAPKYTTTKLTDDEKAQQVHYQALRKKADDLLNHLKEIKKFNSATIFKPQPAKKPDSLASFTKNRLSNWLGIDHFDNFDKKDSFEKVQSFLLFVRKNLSNASGEDLNFLYKQNTAALNAAKAYIEGIEKNHHNAHLKAVEEKLDASRQPRRHLKNQLDLASFTIDAILTGMQLYKIKQQDQDLSLIDAINLLPQEIRTQLKTNLVSLITGNAKFWTKFQLDRMGITMEDVSLLTKDGMTLKGLMDCISVLGMMVQFGFMLQGCAKTLEEIDDKQKEVNQLKTQLRTLEALQKENPDPSQMAQIIVLKNNLKQAETTLRELNSNFAEQRNKIIFLVFKISMVLLAFSFGPVSAWVPFVLTLVEIALDIVEVVVEHGKELAELYEQKELLVTELADMRQELSKTPEAELGDRRLIIKNILALRNQVQGIDHDIKKTYLSLFRSVVMNLMVGAVRFCTMYFFIPLDISTGLNIFTKFSQAVAVLITDFIIEDNKPELEALPYELADVNDLPKKIADTDVQPAPEPEIDFSMMEDGKVYVQRKEGLIRYWVNGQSESGYVLNPIEVLDVDIDPMTDQEVSDLLKVKLEDILVYTEAMGHTNMLEQLDKRDNKEKPADNKKRLAQDYEKLVSDSDDEDTTKEQNDKGKTPIRVITTP